MKFTGSFLLIGLQVFLLLGQGHSFTGARISTRTASYLNESPAFKATSAPSTKQDSNREISFKALSKFVASAVIASTLMIGGAPAVFADEIGISVDAPTLFTGEEVMICKKRGPLGKCTKSEMRTLENDNDKAKAYFKDPSDIIKEKQQAMLAEDTGEGNLLIEKLRKQSVDNKEKNDLTVQRRTFENDQGANVGPFARQVIILNTDGKTYTLLESPQAMRLKKDGLIKDRQFVRQPSQDELDGALSKDGDGIVGAIQGIFSGSE